jgi:hypothetical protein
MTLSEEARERLADVVALQPTKNGELQERWEMDSGSEVHGYLESALADYYYRDENSLIRATEEAAELVDVEPGVVEDDDSLPDRARLDELEARAFSVLAGPEERSESVGSVLHELRAEYGVDAEAEAVRKALRSLVRSNLAETETRTVPTFRRAVAQGEVDVEWTDAAGSDATDGDGLVEIEEEVDDATGIGRES